MDLSAYRERFPILRDTTYLISHSLGAMPAAAEERMLEFARTWRERGIRAWAEGWWEMPVTVGDQIARIIGAPPGSTVMHQNVAVAEAIVISCFRPVDPERNRVVYEEGNFPGVRYLYQAQPELDVVVVADDEAIVEAIDERTLLVPITHVLFKTAEIQNVEAIVRRAHEAGAHVVLDAYQSSGIVPLDVTALNVDFAVGGSVKWLCGGPGNGWLYVRPDLADVLEPTFTGWQAHARPFGFEPELEHAEGSCALCRDRGLRPDRGDRSRPDPRELGASDTAADRPARRGRIRGRQPARRSASRRHRHGPNTRVRSRAHGACSAADPLR